MKIESKINVYSGMRFYTEGGQNITERVIDGRTKVFKAEDRNEAETYARENRSCLYPVRCSDKANHKKRFYYGHAVPK